MLRHANEWHFVKLAMLILVFALLHARQDRGGASRVVTAADYAHAEKFLGYNTNPLVLHAVCTQLAFRRPLLVSHTTAEGSEFVMVDPVSGAKSPAFDQVKLAAALSAAAEHHTTRIISRSWISTSPRMAGRFHFGRQPPMEM